MSSLAVAMTTTEARQVTSRIKLLVETIAANTEKVVSLIEQAESGKAWQVLGYESWPAYVAAEFSGALAGLGKAERIPITAKLSATGMSTRAISAVTETSVGTVHSDVVAAGVQDLNTSQNVVGLDGKTYVRNGRATSRGMLEMADGVPAPTPKPAPAAKPPGTWRGTADGLASRIWTLETM